MASKLAFQQRCAASRGELHAYLRAVDAARDPLGDQARPRLIDVGLDPLGGDSEHRADLTVTESVQLGQDQRGPLALGQIEHRRDHLAQVLALLGLHRRILARHGRLVDLRRRSALAQDAQRGVASDREEPRAQIHAPLVGHQRSVRRRERRLHGVLGVVLGVQDVAAEHQQLASVAVIEDLKRRQVAAAHERNEAVIRRKTRPHATTSAGHDCGCSMAIDQSLSRCLVSAGSDPLSCRPPSRLR